MRPTDIPGAFTVNGRRCALRVGGHHSLLEVLRSEVGLIGSKSYCVQALANGRPVNACLMLAA